MVLKDSFSAKTRTILLSTISGNQKDYQGTMDTLKYTNYVKNIQTHLKLPPIREHHQDISSLPKYNMNSKFREYLLDSSDLIAKGFSYVRIKSNKPTMDEITKILDSQKKNYENFKKYLTKQIKPKPPEKVPKIKKYIRNRYRYQ